MTPSEASVFAGAQDRANRSEADVKRLTAELAEAKASIQSCALDGMDCASAVIIAERDALRADNARLAGELAEARAGQILTDKELISAVITAVMSIKQSDRNEACMKLQRHIIAIEHERDDREAECERLADAHNLQKRLKDESVEYSVKLQRLIERYCHGDPLPHPELHHSQMLAKHIPKDDGKYAELAEANRVISETADVRDSWCAEYVKARDERKSLRAALEWLANSVSGLRAFEDEVRDAISNTNWEVLMLREREAREALRGATGAGGADQPAEHPRGPYCPDTRLPCDRMCMTICNVRAERLSVPASGQRGD